MEVQSAMLCDAAARDDKNGKLYIHGGQWDRISAPKFPTTQPTMAIALVIRVEYDEALTNHTLTIALMKDGEPMGRQIDGRLQVGHAPHSERGAPIFVSQAIPFPLVTFPEPGTYEWVITINGETHRSLRCVLTEAPGRKGRAA